MDLGVLLESPQGSKSSSGMGACTCAFLRAVAPASRFLSRGSRDLWLSLEAFPQGFPTGLSHVPPWWVSILGIKSRQCRENSFLRNVLRHLGDSWNGGTTLEFLSAFLWRAPTLKMRRERPGISPEQAAKGFLISTYEAEMEFFWMWVGPTCFLSSGEGYLGELLELQQGCQGPFGSSRA